MAADLPPIWRNRSDVDPLASALAWRERVEHAGYFTWRSDGSTGQPTRRPWLARRLFRGATPQRRLGMSWTLNPAIAGYFADYRQPPSDGSNGQVWVAVFTPRRLLAYLHDEREYLVDAGGLPVRRWTGLIAGPPWRLPFRS